MPAQYGDPGTPVGGWGIAALWMDTYVPAPVSNPTTITRTQWLVDSKRSLDAIKRYHAKQGYEWIITQYPVSTTTLTTGMEQKTISLIDMGSVINTILASLNENTVKFGSFGYRVQMYADYPFHVIPFLCELEAGETITETEASTESVMATIQDSLGAKNRNVQLLPISRSAMAPNGKFFAEVNYDFAKFANLVAKQIEADNMKGITRHEFKLGALVITQTAGTISFFRTYEMEKFVVPRPKVAGSIL